MKKTMLSSAIAATVAVSASTAMAYDSDVVVTGDRTTEVHMTRGDFAYADNGTSSVGAEMIQIYTVANATSLEGANTQDNYTKTGGPDLGIVTQEFVRVWLPAAVPGTAGVEIPNGTGVEPTSYELFTDINGKILAEAPTPGDDPDGSGSWFFNESTGLAGDAVYNFTSFKERRVITLNACTAPPSITDAISIMQTGGPIPAGCSLTQHGDFAYQTCDTTDQCGGLDKAVPVPAFASAALALGLAGITLVTSRRRSIK